MKKLPKKDKASSKFWEIVSRLILKNRIPILIFLIAITSFWITQFKYMKFTFTEANLLPDSHIENILYNDFLEFFGDEGNLIVLGVKDTSIFNTKQLKKWNKLNLKIESYKEIDMVLSISNLKTLKKNTNSEKFELAPLPLINNYNKKDFSFNKDELFENLPFYENLIYNKKSNAIRSAIFMKSEIVNTSARKDFIFKILIPLIKDFEKQTGINVRCSGMPYIRSLNAQNIIDEMSLFVMAALTLTSLIFFLFFRSIKTTIISMVVVLIGVLWSLGTLGLFEYEITVLTAIIPPLIIVIGVPNCIYLINKYQQEISKHGDKIKALKKVIVKIGNATFMTNLTTASGFATFILTNSKLLKEFGIIASINILGIFIISLLIIPIFFSYMPPPKKKHLKHLENKNLNNIILWIENKIKYKKKHIYLISLITLFIGFTGVYQIKISGNILEDLPKNKEFYNDILFFNDQFNGVLPMEIFINTKKRNGAINLSTINKIEKLEQFLNDIPELSPLISISNLYKFSKQAFYNGNPNYYKLPSRQENIFISKYLKNSSNNSNILNNYIDESKQYLRLTTYMKEMSTERMEEIEAKLNSKLLQLFPKEKYDFKITGKAILFLKGTKFLIKNLILSLSLAILLIALFMSYLFRSFKMILISLLPNLLPLIVTAAIMGFIGITLKPSTILVFSIAFGISVDNTIHFLAKYRQELIENNLKTKKSVYKALREIGSSMLYTSVVLFFGFSVFMISDFGGTKALGGLVSITLFFAMLSNLLILPTLIISLENLSIKKNHE